MLKGGLRKPLLSAVFLLLAGTFVKIQAQDPGERFGSFNIGFSHSRPFGEFADVESSPSSGFAKPGFGMNIGGAVKFSGVRMNYGIAFEFQGHWLPAQHGLLEQYFQDSYDLPEAFQSEFVNERRRWGIYSLMVGPVAGWRVGPLTLEGRFLIGRLDTGSPYYTVDQGNYQPPGWGRFFIHDDNETPWSERRWNLAFNPKLSLLVPLGESWGWRIEGSLFRAQLRQEMERLDLVEENGGYVFQRRQERFRQQIRIWSVGAGIFVNFD